MPPAQAVGNTKSHCRCRGSLGTLGEGDPWELLGVQLLPGPGWPQAASPRGGAFGGCGVTAAAGFCRRRWQEHAAFCRELLQALFPWELQGLANSQFTKSFLKDFCHASKSLCRSSGQLLTQPPMHPSYSPWGSGGGGRRRRTISPAM